MASGTQLIDFIRTVKATTKNVRPTDLLRWLILAVLGLGLGTLASSVGVPAPHLIAAILVGAAAALTGLARRQLPRRVRLGSQTVVGVIMGAYMSASALQSVASSALPLLTVTVASIVLCLGCGALLAKVTGIGLADGTLSMVPGGSAAIVAAADEMGADGRLVAFAQYFRVALVAGTAPLVAVAIHPAGQAAAAPSGGQLLQASHEVVGGAHQLPGVVILIAVCLLGPQLGRKVGLPAPALLGPMVLAAIFSATGAAQGFEPAGLLRSVAFTLVGLEVGLRFTWQSARHAGRLVPHLLAGTILVCGACAGMAWLVSVLSGISFVDAYLATTPGGINAVLAAAASMDANLPVVSAAQSVRLFAVMLVTPPLIQWLTGAVASERRARLARSATAQHRQAALMHH